MDFISEYNIDNIKNDLINEKKKNQNLVEDLKTERAKNEQLRKELQIEKEKNQKYSFQDLIMNSKINIIDELEPKIKSLEFNLKITTAELDNLRQNINNPKSFKDNKNENIITIDFTSRDKKIIYLLPCLITDRFDKLEEKFFERYPQYTGNNTSFTIGGKERKEIIRFKTLQDNFILKHMTD